MTKTSSGKSARLRPPQPVMSRPRWRLRRSASSAISVTWAASIDEDIWPQPSNIPLVPPDPKLQRTEMSPWLVEGRVVDLPNTEIIAGEAQDVQLEPGDIVYVPPTGLIMLRTIRRVAAYGAMGAQIAMPPFFVISLAT